MIDAFSPFSDTLLDQMRQIGDPVFDSLTERIFSEKQAAKAFREIFEKITFNEDIALFGKMELFRAISQFNLPTWADKKLMAKGANFFSSNAEQIMNLLGLLSLPYCYAAANGARVLELSGRMNSDIKVRLTETAQFVWDVLEPDGFEKGGKALASICKVRWIHSIARYHLLKSAWNMQWGYPVNQEDLAGTNFAFSLVIIRGLRQMGAPVGQSEQQSFIHLWSVIAYLLGADAELLPLNFSDYVELEERIRSRQFAASEHGAKLTGSLVQYLSEVAGSNDIGRLMRFLLGDAADYVGLPSINLTLGQQRLLKLVGFFKGLFPPGDTRHAYLAAYSNFKKAS